MKIAIAGRKPNTANYVRFVQSIGADPCVTLDADRFSECDGLILPGGGDITPAFFGESNHGSRNIDTELDILQLKIFDAAVKKKLPVLGICKGMQIINVGLGGTIVQDISTGMYHTYEGMDKYHPAICRPSWLYTLYGESCTVNSAHHQALDRMGKGLQAIQYCPLDGCIEAITHESLPIIGLQWHPERIAPEKSGIDGKKVMAYFSSLITASF